MGQLALGKNGASCARKKRKPAWWQPREREGFRVKGGDGAS